MPTHIPAVRLLGVTWAHRGWRYWNRRFWIALAYTLILAFEIALAFSIWSALMKSVDNETAELAVSCVIVILIAGGFIWALRTLWAIISAERRDDIARLRTLSSTYTNRNRKRSAATGTAIGAGGLAGIPAAVLPLIVGTFAVIGWAFVIFIMGLMPYLSVEEYLAAHDLKISKANS